MPNVIILEHGESSFKIIGTTGTYSCEGDSTGTLITSNSIHVLCSLCVGCVVFCFFFVCVRFVVAQCCNRIIRFL